MNDDARSPGAQTLAWTAAALGACARRANLAATDAPHLVADRFDGVRDEPSAGLEPRDLPLVKRGMTIGRYAAVLGLLPETADEREIANAMRQHRNQCVVARSTLAPNAALDLLLIMVGPRGSEGKDAWRTIALGVERDDRVARKLVWLRPSDPLANTASFDAFAMRTFLARPWASAARFSVASLDDIATILNDSRVPRDTAGMWTKLALERADDPDALVEGLVKVWAERSAK